MNLKQKTQINSFLRGRQGRLTLKLMLFRLSLLMFLLYTFSSIYLLIIDTSFIAELNLYENEYVSVIVCFFDIAVGFVLFLLTIKLNLNYKLSLLSAIDNCNTGKLSLNSLIKYFSLKFVIKIFQLIYFSLGVLPSLIITSIIYNLLNNGVSVAVLVVLSVCNIILLVSGVFNSVCLVQKFGLCDYCFAENQTESVIKIIKLSLYLMDGRCEKTAVYKLSHFIFKLLGLFIPFFSVRESVRELIIMTDKIIPHVRSRAHTEKSVVFYVGKTVTS